MTKQLTLLDKLQLDYLQRGNRDVFIVDEVKFYRGLVEKDSKGNKRHQYALKDANYDDFIVAYEIPTYILSEWVSETPPPNIITTRLFAKFNSLYKFCKFIDETPQDQLCFYEIVQDDVFLYYDIDVKNSEIKFDDDGLIDGKFKTVAEFAESIKDDIIECSLLFLQENKCPTTIDDVYIYTAHKEGVKYSYHVYFRSGCFADISVVGNVAKSIHTEMLDNDLLSINGKKVFDLNVYHHNQAFRLCRNTKYGSNRPFKFNYEFNYKGNIQKRDFNKKLADKPEYKRETFKADYELHYSVISSKFADRHHNRFPTPINYDDINNTEKSAKNIIYDAIDFSVEDAFNKIPEPYRSKFTINSIEGNRVNLLKKESYKCLICSNLEGMSDHYHDNINPYLHIQGKRQYVYYYCRNSKSHGSKKGSIQIGCLKPNEIEHNYSHLDISETINLRKKLLVKSLLSRYKGKNLKSDESEKKNEIVAVESVNKEFYPQEVVLCSDHPTNHVRRQSVIHQQSFENNDYQEIPEDEIDNIYKIIIPGWKEQPKDLLDWAKAQNIKEVHEIAKADHNYGGKFEDPSTSNKNVYCKKITDAYDDQAIISNMGTGKSVAIYDFLERIMYDQTAHDVAGRTRGNRNNLRILIITPRISYKNHVMGELNARFPGEFVDYESVKDRKILNECKCLAIQIESLHKLINNYDVVIMDECEAILKQFSSVETMTKNQRGGLRKTVNTFARIIKKTKRLIIADAFLSKKSIRVFELLHRDLYITRNHSIINKRQSKEFLALAAMYAEIFEKIGIGKKLGVMFGSKAKMDEFILECRKRFPDIKIAYYSRDSEPHVRLELQDVRKNWFVVDLVCFTSTITIGISYDIPDDFDAVYIVATAMTGCVRDLFQMSYRIRHLKENYMGYHISEKFCGASAKGGKRAYPVYRKKLIEHLLERREDIKALKNDYGVDLLEHFPIVEPENYNDYKDGRLCIEIEPNWVFENYLYNTLEDNLSKLHIRDVFDYFLEMCHYEKLPLDETFIEEESEKVKKPMIDTRDLELISQERFETLNGKSADKSSVLSLDDKIAMTYYMFMIIFNNYVHNYIHYKNLFFNLYHYVSDFHKLAHFCYAEKNKSLEELIHRTLRCHYSMLAKDDSFKHILVNDLCKNLGMNNSFQYLKIDKYDFLLHAEYVILNYPVFSKYFPILCDAPKVDEPVKVKSLDITHPATCMSYLNNIFTNYSKNKVKSDGICVRKRLKPGFIEDLKFKKAYPNLNYGNLLKGKGLECNLYDCVIHGNVIYNFISKKQSTNSLNHEQQKAFLQGKSVDNIIVNDKVDENYYPPEYIDKYINDLYDKLRKIVVNPYPTNTNELDEFIKKYTNEFIIKYEFLSSSSTYELAISNRIKELIYFNYPKCYINNDIERYVSSIKNYIRPFFIIKD